jgi:hypothetical protein
LANQLVRTSKDVAGGAEVSSRQLVSVTSVN